MEVTIMARLTYGDAGAEAQFNENDVKQRFLPGASPEASLGGRSGVEVNNADVSLNGEGPSQSELEDRKRGFEQQRQRNRR